ncbi:MAG: sulfotransferase [Akkermansiaceae bacterium]|nr:sulfotransferase [Akkermansiaceae bacterium]
MIRDPRDVCLGCYQQPVGVVTSNVSWLKIEDTMKSYQDIMGVWLKLREIMPDGWLEIRYEQLVEDADAEARKAMDFL